jgi:penicillin-binding protein 2
MPLRPATVSGHFIFGPGLHLTPGTTKKMRRRAITASLLAAIFGALLAVSPSPASAQAARTYRVAKGDSLNSLSRKFGMSVAALASANGMSVRDELRAGETLKIPVPGAKAAAATPRPVPAPAEPAEKSASGRYTVRPGDTLASIARRFAISLDELRTWNNLTGSNLLTGSELIVDGPALIAPETKVVVSPATRGSRPVVTRVSTFANSTDGDVATFDDPVVREAAVDALGRYNGSVVAIDPNSGRILTVVNQKLAFSQGFIPCSTIKPVIAVAALEESVIRRDTMIKVGNRSYMNLVEALARSNNFFFEELGRRMGFDTVSKYARLLGLGELTGYNLPEERPGAVPSEPPRNGGVARMSSFGEGIQMTPLQLASLVSTLANGGTMYYLQYPRTTAEQQAFEPRIKRRLDIEPLLPDIRDGMLAAVLYGTARRSYTGEGEQPLGKTGTCSDSASHIGWFVSYADQENPKIVLAVLMRGRTNSTSGPFAAQIAGKIYRRLSEKNYFADRANPVPRIPAVAAVTGSGN